jgi:crotonobetainyl-CoA:carnitine CoA-transferase CaiB-like acyl-CoA transferase
VVEAKEAAALKALDGVRVLELTTGVSGPLAAAFFADFGADVVKVEPPDGDPERRRASFVPWNRGKRSVTARPGSAQDRARVNELGARADVIIVRDAAALAAWELDAGSLTSAPGGPVVLMVPPWQGAPPWAGGGESQALLAAASGYSRRQASYDGGPVDIVYPHLLYVQAIIGATAATSALAERLRSGCGQVVTVDGLHAVAETFTGNYTLDPEQPPPNSAVGPGGANPTYTHYQASDGKWFLVAGLIPKFQERLLHVIGEAWIIDDARVAGDLSTLFGDENRDWVKACLRERLATRTRQEWLDALHAGGVPCAPLNHPAEAFGHEQCRTIGISRPVKDPRYGDLTIVGQPVTPSLTPASVSSGAPDLGTPVSAADWLPRDDTAQRVGAGWAGATGGRATGGPLGGIRVLLLGSFVAGPYGAFLVGHLGADVIKIEAPEGDPWRARGFYYSDGMRSIALDLKNPAAHEVFMRLAAKADVVIDNLRPGVAAGLGVSYADTVTVNPDVVTVSLTGFGAEGPLAMEPGFDPVLQAWSGMCVTQGGDDMPVLYTVPVNDVSGAGLLAFGACLGLYHRLRTGEGQPITTSLAAAAMFMQCGQLVEGTDDVDVTVGGRDFTGPSELDRYYRTSDGWIRLQAEPGTTAGDVLAALGSGDGRGLAAAFAVATAGDALSRLYTAGIPAAPARLAKEVVLSGDHPGRFGLHRPAEGIKYYRPSEYCAFSRTAYRQEMRPPGAGEHSLEILAELGCTPDESRRIVDGGAVLAGQPMLPRVLNPYR